MPEKKRFGDYDWWLLAIVAAICIMGLLEIWSATHASDLAGMQWKQLNGSAWECVMFLLIPPGLPRDDGSGSIAVSGWPSALLAVLAMGHTRFGAKRWLPCWGAFLQVSELVKLIIIIVLARFFCEVRTEQLSLVDLVKAAFW